MTHFVWVTMAAVLALLWGHWQQRSVVAGVAKMVASSAFVAHAVALGACGGGSSDTLAQGVAAGDGLLAAALSPGTVLLVALGLAWLGDGLLLASGKPRLFLAGLGAFLLAHVVYVAAFLQATQPPAHLLTAGALAVLPIAVAVWRWLSPHLNNPRQQRMRKPVIAYLSVIGAMLATACAASWHAGTWLLAAGALSFAISDIAVARHRFVVAEFPNKAWGLPLYYAGQLALVSALVG